MSQDNDELAKAKRAAKTLGEVIEKQCQDVLDVTGLHHLINEDGDGHWDVVWMRLFEMRDELVDLKESTIGAERKRGDSWRDQAQEMRLRVDAYEAMFSDEAIEKVRGEIKHHLSPVVGWMALNAKDEAVAREHAEKFNERVELAVRAVVAALKGDV